MPTVDVLIIGAGPAGCATALSFLGSKPDGICIVVNDSNTDTFKVGECLPAEAIVILGNLSPALPITQPFHLRCSGNASVWESPEVHELFGIMNPFGYGWHLDRALFDQTLRDAVSATGNDRLVNGRFTGAKKVDGLWEVSVTNSASGEMTYRTSWLIDASGRKASAAQKIGAKVVKSDDLLAFYVVFKGNDSLTLDTDHRTLIEATPLGWFYSAQIPHQRRIVVFHTLSSSTASKLARKLSGFLDILSEQSTLVYETIKEKNYFVDEGEANQWPKATVARSSHLEPFGNQEERWCAVGDACMAFDPLSSQGMITALKCGGMLGMSLAEAKVDLEPLEIIYEDILKDYEVNKKWFYRQAMFDGEEFWSKQK